MEEREEKYFSARGIILKVLFLLLFVFLVLWLAPLPNLKQVNDTLFNDNVESMQDAAKSYYTNERLPQILGQKKSMTLQEMLDMKIVLPFLDSNGKSCNIETSYVEVTKMENEYILKVFLDCESKTDYILEHIGCYDHCIGLICETPEEKETADLEYQYKKYGTLYLIKYYVADKTKIYEYSKKVYEDDYIDYYKTAKEEITEGTCENIKIKDAYEETIKNCTISYKTEYTTWVHIDTVYDTSRYAGYVYDLKKKEIKSGLIHPTSCTYCNPLSSYYTYFISTKRKVSIPVETCTTDIIEYEAVYEERCTEDIKTTVNCNGGEWTEDVTTECPLVLDHKEVNEPVLVDTKITWSDETSLSGWTKTGKTDYTPNGGHYVYYGGSNNWIIYSKIPSGSKYKIADKKTNQIISTKWSTKTKLDGWILTGKTRPLESL